MVPKSQVRRGIPDVEVAVLSSDDSEIDCWAPTKVGPPSFGPALLPPRLFTTNAQQPRAFAPPSWTEGVPNWIYGFAIGCGVFVLGIAFIAARLL